MRARPFLAPGETPPAQPPRFPSKPAPGRPPRRRGLLGAVAALAVVPAIASAASADLCPFPIDSHEYHRWWRRKGLLSFGRDGLLREAARIRRWAGGNHPTADEYEALALECPA